ncbi:MAG: nucleotidyltransferase domain-containing protein [Anaerolineae bacterium]
MPVLDRLPPRARELLGVFSDQVRRINLYGSYARGEADPDSDVDVMGVVGWEEGGVL